MQGNRRFEKIFKWDASNGKVFAENNLALNNSCKDRISKQEKLVSTCLFLEFEISAKGAKKSSILKSE